MNKSPSGKSGTVQTLLAPDIVEAILDGKQGPEVTLARVLEPFPAEWAAQTDIFGQIS